MSKGDFLPNVQRSDVDILKKLRQKEYCTIFHAEVRGRECIMKVGSAASIVHKF